MTESTNNKSFLERWSDKKSSVEKEKLTKKTVKSKSKSKSKIKNQILESDEKIDEKYAKLSDNEILEKLKLPDPNKIKKEEDLNVFFKKSIPDRLKKIAMRRLWRINPIISFADSEINDYADDFTDAANVVDDLQTSYIVGQGYLKPNIEKEPETLEEDTDEIKTKKITNTKKNVKKKSKPKMKSTKATSKSLQQSSEKQVKNIEEKDEKQIQSSIQNEKDTLPKIKPKNLTFIKK